MRLVAISIFMASAAILPTQSIAQSNGDQQTVKPIKIDIEPKPEPRNTKGLPKELRPIDDGLRGGLINDPTFLDWNHYGLGRDLVVDETYPGGGAALRIAMGNPGPVYSGGVNIPLVAKLNKGEQVTVGFFARAIDAPTNDGVGKVRVRFQLDKAPYPGFGEKVLEIGPEWKWHEVTAIADRNLKSKGIVALQFGMLRQTVEVGQAIVVTGTSTVFD